MPTSISKPNLSQETGTTMLDGMSDWDSYAVMNAEKSRRNYSAAKRRAEAQESARNLALEHRQRGIAPQ